MAKQPKYHDMPMDELVNQALDSVCDPDVIAALAARRKEAVATLVSALGGGGQKRWQAAALLGELEEPAAVAVLIEALGDADPDVVRWSANALGQIGDPRATPALIGALRHPEQGVREYAAVALGQLRAGQAVTPLMGIALHDHWYVRCQAIQALEQIGDGRALPILIQCLSADGEGWEYVVKDAARALARLGDPVAVAALVGALVRPTTDTFYTQTIQEALVSLGPGNLDPLLATLSHPDEMARAAAAEVLGDIGDARAAAPLLGLFGDPCEHVRHQSRRALKALKKKGVKVVVPRARFGDQLARLGRWVLDCYFVIPSTQGFSPYRTGWFVHLAFSAFVCAGLFRLFERFTGAAPLVCLSMAAIAVFLLWGAGVFLGIASHYNPLLTLAAFAGIIATAVFPEPAFLLGAITGGLSHAASRVLVGLIQWLGGKSP